MRDLSPDDAPSPPRPGGIAARAMAGVRAAAPDYLAGLNPEQREAVETLDGPLLVLAGAGTGKTRVLTTRIAHILALGRARPFEILAVTFTNKAAREMRERVGKLLGHAAEGMEWLGTFHSIGARMLRRHAELAGLKPSFTILDTDDQIRLIKQVLAAENIDDKRWPARQLAFAIDGWKNRALSPEKVLAGEAQGYAAGRGAELYAIYQARLKQLNAVDFGDLLLEPIRIFREQPDVLAQYHRRFRYMLVDEYQDTNVAQYLWLRLLAQGSKNLACVGDDDQSIYGWRGAEVENILRFDKDFPDAKVVRLERNYRSTGHILNAASHLIARNEGRLGKTLRPQTELGDKVTVAGSWDSGEEARAIGDEIEALQTKGHKLDDMAILVRASFQMREFEERFITLGLNYRVVGGPRFYERAEIRDAMAYLRVVASPADSLAFERIVNVPKRGLGDVTVKAIIERARADEVTMPEAARRLCDAGALGAKARAALKDLVLSFDRWSAELDKIPHVELAEKILEESGYTDMWSKDRTAEAQGRLENLKELVRSMEPFENLRGFLEHVSLVMDVDGARGEDAVTVMTLHAAKGLEFDTVFLPGWEEGLFPHQRSLDENGRAGLEEERRLAYVGLTRARRRAKVWFASNRRVHGMWQSSIPSRFLDELPEADVDVIEVPAAFSSGMGGVYGQSRFDKTEPFNSTYSTPGWKRAQERGFDRGSPGPGARSRGPMTIEGELVAASTAPSAGFAEGARVFHQKFGNGTVVEVEGNKLTVAFDKAGQKKLLDSFVKAA
ncbi:UvrD-helicase domain-containing protein [Chelatococcus sambhunathii]|uniref:DNA 3'-5' helicase n=1 Tax=Chelatococcus sambhunathii TaxID=363953 RepID=A0ABU1DBW2_9HYPH|nr:UvrD-helicase domain-containing protein [Chelatococcus sambhunathii]MDR4305556.1 UvrD-helicase domain-containing protein [Chelatococcus sambhunathii]